MEKSEILKSCLKKGFLLDKDILEIFLLLEEEPIEILISKISSMESKEKVITKKILKNYSTIFQDYFANKNFAPFFEKLGIKKVEEKGEDSLSEEKIYLKVLHAPTIIPKKVDVQEFVGYFRARYEQIKKYLQAKNLENLKSLRRITNSRESCFIIVGVLNKSVTKNGNIILDVEDMTGSGKVLISKNKEEVFEKGREVLIDDIVAINVSGNNEILFANDIVYPEIVLSEKKKSSKDYTMAVISDIHLGSIMFLEENFLKFIKWLNGEQGSKDQRKLAEKTKYLFIVGDCVDGVGITPGQEVYLKIKDFRDQYKKLAEMLGLLRKDLKIIMCPGQHDAVWVGEPQPPIGEDWAEGLHKLDNLTLVPNPCLVEIEGGFKVYMYHGASMQGFIESIPRIRLKYNHDSPTTVAKEMLKRRHVSPMHGLVDYIPTKDKDNLVLDFDPDIFLTGDQHRCEISSYNDVLLMSGSCWQSITPFEEKVGNNPAPCKVPIFNLKTREVKIIDFSGGDNETTGN